MSINPTHPIPHDDSTNPTRDNDAPAIVAWITRRRPLDYSVNFLTEEGCVAREPFRSMEVFNALRRVRREVPCASRIYIQRGESVVMLYPREADIVLCVAFAPEDSTF